MHGFGNDFVIIDLITQNPKLHTAHFQRLADRHLGIGCDQVLLVEPPTTINADFSYKIFNADGSEAAQCGNGIRCIAKFVYDSGLVNKRHLLANSKAGDVVCEVHDHNEVMVQLPLRRGSLGNQHHVEQVADLNSIDIVAQGKKIALAAKQPLNVSFMQVIDQYNIKLRVYEHGTGVTLACGTAAAAACMQGQKLKLLADAPIAVQFATGVLYVTVLNSKKIIQQVGATFTGFTGSFRV